MKFKSFTFHPDNIYNDPRNEVCCEPEPDKCYHCGSVFNKDNPIFKDEHNNETCCSCLLPGKKETEAIEKLVSVILSCKTAHQYLTAKHMLRNFIDMFTEYNTAYITLGVLLFKNALETLKIN